jgi:hypothetical protein
MVKQANGSTSEVGNQVSYMNLMFYTRVFKGSARAVLRHSKKYEGPTLEHPVRTTALIITIKVISTSGMKIVSLKLLLRLLIWRLSIILFLYIKPCCFGN